MATLIANNETSTRLGAPPVPPNSLIAPYPTTTVETQNLTVEGTFTLGDAVTDVTIFKGRTATGSAAGSALALGATYTYGEANEWRYTLSSWAGTGDQFNGLYLRPQSDADNASGSLRGAEIMAVANASAVSDLKGAFTQAYIKGDTTETIGTVYGLQAEISFDASRANSITLTEAPALLGKILAGKVADYTKFHGAIFRFGDMDGGTRTFGNGVTLEDDAGTSGTNVLTTGINIAIGTTTGVLVAGASTNGVRVTGTATNAFSTATGTFTNGVNVGGTVTTGVTIGAATTGVAVTGAVTTGVVISGTSTNGVSVTGNATSAFQCGTGTFTNGVILGGTITTGVSIGACSGAALSVSGITTVGLIVNGATTTGVNIVGNATDGFKTTTGTFTNGVNLGGTLTTGVTIGVATTGVALTGTVTTGLLISGASTTGVSITGNATDAIKTATGTFTNGINIGGTVTTGATIGACATLIANTGAISGHVFAFSAESTAVEITAATASIPANTGYLLMQVGATTYRITVYANS